jgi:hypothetical protein
MSEQHFFRRTRRGPDPAGPGLAILCVLGLTILSPGFFRSQTSADETKTGNAGTCVSEKGSMLRRAGPDDEWKIVSQNDQLPAGDLIVGLPGAMLDSANGAVRVTLLADLDQNSPYPIKEAAVRLQSAPETDLALVLDRGRIDLANRKKDGPATVRVRVRNASWDIVLAEPGGEVALELFGRWPPGVPFRKEADAKHEPVADLVILVLKGQVTLKHGGREFAMQAPPGPAMIEWDSISGQDESAQRLEKLPPWASETGEETPEAKSKKAAIERFRQSLTSKSIDESLEEFLKSEDRIDRALAIYVMAALDKLAAIGTAFRETKHPDVLDISIVALRHWIGRGAGQDQILYNRLVEGAKLKPVHAETIMQLLHGFGEVDLGRPETYQTLIDYLDHDLLGIRALAYWHLYRLVPAGRDLGYNPLEAKDNRETAVKKWRALVPRGKVPPRPEAEAKKQ